MANEKQKITAINNCDWGDISARDSCGNWGGGGTCVVELGSPSEPETIKF